MGQLGHAGYQLYDVDGEVIVISPTRTVRINEANVLDEYDILLHGAEDDEEIFVDHKINRSLIKYEDIQ